MVSQPYRYAAFSLQPNYRYLSITDEENLTTNFILLGVLSACPRSLGLAAASDLFAESQLTSLLQDAKSNVEHYATLFSNGNPDLAKGIQAQHEIALRIWEQDKIAPVEMNVGTLGGGGGIIYTVRNR